MGWVVVLVAPVKNTQGRALSLRPVPESEIRLISLLGLTEKPLRSCCSCSYREELKRLHKVRRRICRRCLGSWSSRCLVWLRLTTLAKLCLVAGEVGQVGLVRLAMLAVEVVGLVMQDRVGLVELVELAMQDRLDPAVLDPVARAKVGRCCRPTVISRVPKHLCCKTFRIELTR